ncbi:ipis-1-like [Dermacentor variabilis]|uniref:ipis-1-like n=1 Tax=Dermacentor variabilis TaxID=34621 RepID=UPI003F5B0201
MRQFFQNLCSLGSRGQRNQLDRHQPPSGAVSGSTTPVAAVHSRSLAHSISGFAVDLYRQLSLATGNAGSQAGISIDNGGSKDGVATATVAPANLVFSPLAVAAALSMTLAGARYGTAKELASALHVRDDDQVHGQLAAQLSQSANRALKVTFEVNNCMYADRRYHVLEGYLSFLRDTYGDGSVCFVDFAEHHREVRAEANERVARLTANAVRELLAADSIGPGTALALVSAACFRGAWESPFQPGFTGPDEFYVDPETVVRVDMMTQMHSFAMSHCDQLQATALEMPHVGGKTAMIFILPDEMGGLRALEQNLTAALLSDLVQGLREKPNVMLKLPKFVVQQSLRLRDTLGAMGVRELFTRRANLSGIFETGSPALWDVFHGAFLDVNEEGTVSAAPGTDCVPGSGPGMGEITHFAVNRPFMFLVGSRRTTFFFLMGSVRRP